MLSKRICALLLQPMDLVNGATNSNILNSPADYCQKWLDRSLFYKSMKFGTVVVHSITKDISYDAKQNRSKIWYFGVKQ